MPITAPVVPKWCKTTWQCHVYSTGLNGSLPHDMPAEQSAATFHLRGAYGPSMSQMFADQGGQPLPEGHLPRAPLRSHAEYIDFCRCLLDDEGHQCWREILDSLGVADPSSWIRYAARFATLPPLPAQLALPAPVWSMVSSTILMYLQPALLSALAVLMSWPHLPDTNPVGALHFSGYSAGSYTAIALEADYRLLRVFPRVVGFDANYYHWGYCNPQTGAPWHGTALTAGVPTSASVRRTLRSACTFRARWSTGLRCWQDGYLLVALWDDMGEAYLLPTMLLQGSVDFMRKPGGNYDSGHAPIAELAMMADLQHMCATRFDANSTEDGLRRTALLSALPVPLLSTLDPSQGVSPPAHHVSQCSVRR